jgi:hypothetical protein
MGFPPIFGLMDGVSAAMKLLGALHILQPSPDGGNKLNDFVVKQIFPGIFGLDWKDEAIFNAIVSHLDMVSYNNIVELMGQLSPRKRARMILVVALMPDPDERLVTMERLAQLSPEEFLKACESLRLVPMDFKAIKKTRELLQALGYADDDGKILWEKMGKDTHKKLIKLSTWIDKHMKEYADELQDRTVGLIDRADALQQRVVEAGLARPETPLLERMTIEAIERREARRSGGWRQLIRSVTGF